MNKIIIQDSSQIVFADSIQYINVDVECKNSGKAVVQLTLPYRFKYE